MTTENQPQLDVPQLVLEAHERCKEHLSPTPLEYSRYLSEKIKGEVWLKLDMIYVSPYNDPMVVGGQGTCGYEISKQLPDLNAAFFACGAGGLLTGSAGWLKSENPKVEAFGVSPENSPVMYESMRANKILEMETYPTLADTCAGGVDLDSITFGLCKRYADEIMLITETEIEASIRLLFEQHRLVVEGSGVTFLWNCSNASLRNHISTDCLCQ